MTPTAAEVKFGNRPPEFLNHCSDIILVLPNRQHQRNLSQMPRGNPLGATAEILGSIDTSQDSRDSNVSVSTEKDRSRRVMVRAAV